MTDKPETKPYPDVDSQVRYPEIEREILAQWAKHGTFEASAMCMPAYSPGVRTSSSTAPFSTSAVAWSPSMTSIATGGGAAAWPGSAGKSSGRCFFSDAV